MITGQAADLLRDVPETAVRLYLGAKVEQHDDGIRVELDGKSHIITPEALELSQTVANVLSVRPREVNYATEVLELRHDAEEHFLSMVFGESSNVPQVLFVPAGQMASAYYRALIPSDTMTDRGLALAHYTTRLDIVKALRYQVLWVQLVASPVLYNIVAIAKKHGVKILYDIDDRWNASLPDSNPAADLYAPGGEYDQDTWKMIEIADLVTVSTQPLADYIRSRASAVQVLPNMVPASVFPIASKPPADVIRILWAGSPTHKKDLAIVVPAIRSILKERSNVRFCCFGENFPSELEEVRDQVDLVPFVSFDEYYGTLSNIGPHLAIAPLRDDEFNGSKSAIKFLEYSACGYHTLMSPVGEYKDLGLQEKSLVKDDEWEDAIRFHLDHMEVTHAAAAKSKAWVRENRCIIKAKAKPWFEAIEKVLKLSKTV